MEFAIIIIADINDINKVSLVFTINFSFSFVTI